MACVCSYTRSVLEVTVLSLTAPHPRVASPGNGYRLPRERERCEAVSHDRTARRPAKPSGVPRRAPLHGGSRGRFGVFVASFPRFSGGG